MALISNFQSSLLREKFEIYDPTLDRESNKPAIALSNRMVVRLQPNNDSPSEEYIVRAHNMHLCVRFAARLVMRYNSGGSIVNRATPYDWDNTWSAIQSAYERIYNDHRWIAVYRYGQVIYEQGERHPLLDLIEKCELNNDKEYDYAISLAEAALKETGKSVKIDYDANVALVTTFEENEGRCGVILRGAHRTTTFSFTAFGNDEYTLNYAQCLSASAAFLEGIQLAFQVGMNIFKIATGIIPQHSAEHQKTKDGQKRVGELNLEIENLESRFKIRYRPDRPNFGEIIKEAEELAMKTIDVREALKAIENAQAEEQSASGNDTGEDGASSKDDEPIDILNIDD